MQDHIMDFSIIVMSFFSLVIFHFSILTGKYFPKVSFSTNQDIQIANYLRLGTITFSGISLSYGLVVFGHIIGWGGFENLTNSAANLELLHIILSFIGVGLFSASRFIEYTIYKDLNKYDEYLELTRGELIAKIKKEGLLINQAKNKTEALEGYLEKRKKELDKATAESLELAAVEQRKTKELAATRETTKHVISETNRMKQKIEHDEAKVKADKALIDVLTSDVKKLDGEMLRVKTLLSETEETLRPLIEKRDKNKGELNLRKNEYQNMVNSTTKTRKEITSLTKSLKDLIQKSEKERKKKSTLESNHENVLQGLDQIKAEITGIENQIQQYEDIAREHNILEMSQKEKEEVLEIKRKTTEDHFQKRESGDNTRIFED